MNIFLKYFVVYFICGRHRHSCLYCFFTILFSQIKKIEDLHDSLQLAFISYAHLLYKQFSYTFHCGVRMEFIPFFTTFAVTRIIKQIQMR